MVDFAQELHPINIEEEMKQSYLDYAMSVIVGRALPDVRDGLKPVHRRVLYAMSELGTDWNKPYKKSARVVGDVIGKYHPHGDTAVYDTIVRMAQPFSMRYVLVDGQGNFGSVDGDAPAAMRYTEVRMSRIAHELLADIERETVDFAPNYDGAEREPVVLPARIPNLLVNGSSGIAVGMATNIPPHNLSEIISACVALIDNPALDLAALMQLVPGPDFPTAGIVNGTQGIVEAYKTGRGRLLVRARAHIEGDADKGARQSIIVTELPYQVNKAHLIEKIADLVKEKRLEGISELRDESDKDGMRMVIELKRGENAEVVLNNLYQHTQMQNAFGINMVALVDGQPRLLSLKQILECFIRHRQEVVTRRTQFDLRKARERAHILEGLAVALANIDEVIALIKKAADPAAAKMALMGRSWLPGVVQELLTRAGSNVSRPLGLPAEFGLTDGQYRLSEVQAQAILDLRLHRLTSLEQEKIVNEFNDILTNINNLLDILAHPEKLMRVIRGELLEMRELYGDARRTEIIASQQDLTTEDLISVEDVVVTLSHAGYVKSQPLTLYRAQRRGGKGRTGASVKDEDFVDKLFIASTHDTLLCFSSRGKVYWLKVYQIPQAGPTARGRPIVNLLPLEEGERITALLSVHEFDPAQYVFMATAQGTVKKTSLEDFSRPRPSGIIALDLRMDDRLVDAALTDGTREVMLFTDAGKVIRFPEEDVRPMGRGACGVRGIRLDADQRVIALIIAEPGTVLTATEKGYGKRTPIEDYPQHGRGGQGVISIQTSERNGKVVGAVLAQEGDEVMLISNAGTLVRTRVKEISVMSRNTQGVKLISLEGEERLSGLERIVEVDDDTSAQPDSNT
ncbi:MAG: DNA gyrase subunit A [Gammaproteobacteria bacterium]|nr:DNA gyrase subunit A [Gammaproteobacteria bacterium]